MNLVLIELLFRSYRKISIHEIYGTLCSQNETNDE
jgi:hypothetical protein